MGNKNNKRISLRRRTSDLVKRAKLKQQRQDKLDSVLECTHQGQVNKDFTNEINKEQCLQELKNYDIVTRTQQTNNNKQPVQKQMCIIC